MPEKCLYECHYLVDDSLYVELVPQGGMLKAHEARNMPIC